MNKHLNVSMSRGHMMQQGSDLIIKGIDELIIHVTIELYKPKNDTT